VQNYFAGLMDLRFHGNKANNTSGHCFYTAEDADGNAPNDLSVVRVFFSHAPEDGMYLESSWGYRFTRCLWEHCAGRGAYLYNATQYYFTDCFWSGNSGIGLEFGGGGGEGYVQGYTKGNGGHGARFTGEPIIILNATENDNHGLDIRGPASGWIDSYNNSKAGGFYNVQIYDTNNAVLSGRLPGGPDITADIRFYSAHENIFEGFISTDPVFEATSDRDNVVNGRGLNGGDPGAGGAWNGKASFAYRHNVTVEDVSVSPHDLYKADKAGNWVGPL